MRLHSVYYISLDSSTCFGSWHLSNGSAEPVDQCQSCNYSCTSSWWCVSTPETCRAVYRYV